MPVPVAVVVSLHLSLRFLHLPNIFLHPLDPTSSLPTNLSPHFCGCRIHFVEWFTSQPSISIMGNLPSTLFVDSVDTLSSQRTLFYSSKLGKIAVFERRLPEARKRTVRLLFWGPTPPSSFYVTFPTPFELLINIIPGGGAGRAWEGNRQQSGAQHGLF